MKRPIVLVLGLLFLPFAAVAPAADATGAGACTITGNINFSAASLTATDGKWSIEPAVISCQGLYNGYERILGPGTFTGSGTYTAVPGPGGSCLHQVGAGTADFTVLTSKYDVHLVERQAYALVGSAGKFDTDSLHGTFEVLPPFEGDCLTKPLTRALFVAQAVLLRFVPPDPSRYYPR